MDDGNQGAETTYDREHAKSMRLYSEDMSHAASRIEGRLGKRAKQSVPSQPTHKVQLQPKQVPSSLLSRLGPRAAVPEPEPASMDAE